MINFSTEKDFFLEYPDFELSDSEYSNPGYIEYTPPRQESSSSFEDYFSGFYDSEMTQSSKESDSSNSEESIDSFEMQSDDTVTSTEEDMKETMPLEDYESSKEFGFSQDHGVSPTLQTLLQNDSPLSFFTFFIDEGIINDMVMQTNLYAFECMHNKHQTSSHSRLRVWEPTTSNEMLKFLGIIGYMNLVRLPSIQCYWSTNKFFKHKLIRKTMSRNRFRNILSMWSFGEFREQYQEDGMCKIQSLADTLASNCKMGYKPGENCYISHSVQSCDKLSKRKVTIFKLLTDDGYTWNLKICPGTELDSSKEAMDLCDTLLYSGRTVFTDNYLTSLDLSAYFIAAKTHLVGTLAANENKIPEYATEQLKKGQVIFQKNNHNVTVMRYPNKHNVLVLSTKDVNETLDTAEEKGQQPKFITDFKKAKRFASVVDKSSTWNTCLDKSLNWHKKIAVELIWNVALTNAHLLYQTVCKKMSLVKFRQEVIKGLLLPNGSEKNKSKEKDDLKQHTFIKKKGVSRIGRKYCRGCYNKKLREEITKNKVRKVISFCLECEGQPRYCLPCFKESHN